MQPQILQSTRFRYGLQWRPQLRWNEIRRFFAQQLDGRTCAVGRCTVLLQTAVICCGPLVAMETMQVAFDPYQVFQTQPIRN